MREAINFNYNGISSEDMGVQIVSTKSGLFEDIFVASRKIVETSTPYTNKPYLHKIALEPLSFSVSIFINEWKDRDNLSAIARWLTEDTYKPLMFDALPNRVCFAIFEGNSSLIHNGAKDGYINLNVRCNSPYTYSATHLEMTDLNDSLVDKLILIYNDGDRFVKPELVITKKESQGLVVIKNETTGQRLEINNLGVDEEVYINCETEEIVSSLESNGVYRFDDHNDIWLELSNIEGNVLSISGGCDVKLEFRAVYLTS